MDHEALSNAAEANPAREPDRADEAGAAPEEKPSVRPQTPTPTPEPPTRKPGKPPGAPGFGRTQVFNAHETLVHRPDTCPACAAALPADAPSVAYAGFQPIDLRWGDPEQPGLHLRFTDHRFQDRRCGCGPHTRASPGVGLNADLSLEPVALSEWRLIGPGLASMIVALHLRFRMSYRRIAEFLHDWLGLSLSIGTLNGTVQEATAATAPLEQELIAAVLASDQLHADETSWPQGRELRWFWVFTSATVTLFVVAKRARYPRPPPSGLRRLAV